MSTPTLSHINTNKTTKILAKISTLAITASIATLIIGCASIDSSHTNIVVKSVESAAIKSPASQAQLDTYIIDQHHANVRFAINHMNTSTVTGGIYELTGELQFSEKAQQGYIDISIPMDNMHSVSAIFIEKLKSKKFFDVATYPTARFQSTKWHFADANNVTDGEADSKQSVKAVEGLLTMHGKTNPITLTADSFNCYFSPIAQKTMCGGDFSTVIDRTQWGVDKYVMMGVPKDVAINIEIEGIKQ